MKKIFFIYSLLLFALPSISQVRINMQYENGVYTTPCTVNGLKLRFIFDTGASTVSMSLSEAIFMLKNGFLNEDDLHGSSYSQIANGEIVENTTVNLRELEIGGIILHNIEATIIHELSAPLLLGQSAIRKLGKIQIEDNQLTILNYDIKSSDNACIEARKLINKANEHYFAELYALALDLYQEAYNLCPNIFDYKDYDMLGALYYVNDNNQLAIKYLEKAVNYGIDYYGLYFVYLKLEDSYLSLNNFERSLLNIQKALSLANENSQFAECYYRMGIVRDKQGKVYESIRNFEKAIEYKLKDLSTDENEIMKGKINNRFLGIVYMQIAIIYYSNDQKIKSNKYMIKSALCGYESAITFCKDYDIKYEMFIEK